MICRGAAQPKPSPLMKLMKQINADLFLGQDRENLCQKNKSKISSTGSNSG